MGYTITPDQFIDDILPELTANGWRLFCFVWRKTEGYKKLSDEISYSQIADGTKMKSKNTISAAIKDVAKVITVDNGVGRGNMCRFDITELVNKEEHKAIPFQCTKGIKSIPLPERNGIETEPNEGADPVKGIDFDQKGIDFIHTTKQSTTTKDFKSKDLGKTPTEENSQSKNEVNLLPETRAQDYFIRRINVEREGKKLRLIKKFDNPTQKGECEAQFQRLGQDEFVKCLKYWITEGVTAKGKLLNRLKVWMPRDRASPNGHKNGHHNSTKGATNAANQRHSQPTGASLAAEPYYDPATGDLVYPDGRRESYGVEQEHT